MASLERLRGSLEDLEAIDGFIVDELDSGRAKTQREHIVSDHKIATYLNAAKERAQTCLDIYKDEDGLKKTEIDQMTGPNALTNFYDQLRETKAYHRRFNTGAAGALPAQAPLKEQLDAKAEAENKFSGEESTGRHLDLNSFYQVFVNLPGNKKHAKIDYRTYLDIFADFRQQGFPVANKRAAYVAYVKELQEYLFGFHERCNPLTDPKEIRDKVREEFEKSLSGENLKQKDGYVQLLTLMYAHLAPTTRALCHPPPTTCRPPARPPHTHTHTHTHTHHLFAQAESKLPHK